MCEVYQGLVGVYTVFCYEWGVSIEEISRHFVDVGQDGGYACGKRRDVTC